MAAKTIAVTLVVALAARPLAASPASVGCGRSIKGGSMMGATINTNGASEQVQLAKGGATIACGGSLTAGDKGLTLVKGSTGSQYLIEAEMSAGTGAWGIISGSCEMQRIANSVSNTFTVPPSGTVTMRIAHASGYGTVTTSQGCVYNVVSGGSTGGSPPTSTPSTPTTTGGGTGTPSTTSGSGTTTTTGSTTTGGGSSSTTTSGSPSTSAASAVGAYVAAHTSLAAALASVVVLVYATSPVF